MIKFFWMPLEILYYVIIPMVLIIFAYFIFTISYRNKKGTYYYNYVVDYVYSTLGILFCSLLLCLLLGYAIATIQILILTEVISRYWLLAILIGILPLVPACFLVYITKVYVRNLKRKDMLDECLKHGQFVNNKKNN